MALISSTVLLFVASFIGQSVVTANVPDFEQLITTLRGDDLRIFRYDADENTALQQANDAICGKGVLEQALGIIVDGASVNYLITPDEAKLKLTKDALEYITWCITDNPTNRNIFASYSGIHEAVIELIRQLYPLVEHDSENGEHLTAANSVAAACHVVYITAFANPTNHQTFINKGVISQLSAAVKATARKYTDEDDIEQIHTPYPFVTMWAAAALSNIAASYCATEDNGRCYWYWTENGLELEPESLPMTSDGALARQTMLKDEELVTTLGDLACTGPVPTRTPDELEQDEEAQQEPVMIGHNAEINRDEYSPNILPWAAVGALKNLAIESDSHEKYLNSIIGCFCYHSHSPDWIEENKGGGILHHMRRSNPCYFAHVTAESEDEEGDEDGAGEIVGHRLCVDHLFYHADGYTCSDFNEEEEPTEEECSVLDRNGAIASEACCACGGGTVVTTAIGDGEDDGAVDEL